MLYTDGATRISGYEIIFQQQKWWLKLMFFQHRILAEGCWKTKASSLQTLENRLPPSLLVSWINATTGNVELWVWLFPQVQFYGSRWKLFVYNWKCASWNVHALMELHGTWWNFMEVGHVQKLFGLQLKMCRHHGTPPPLRPYSFGSLNPTTEESTWPNLGRKI